MKSELIAYTRAEEKDLCFIGFLLFFDPPKVDVEQTIVDLKNRGVQLKIITGDNEKVARHVADAVHLPVSRLMTGAELNAMSDDALWHAAERTTIFAEVDPNQKERIILALRKTKHVVGYMGDGINDAPALHAADVGISVDTAVDVAKDAADFVLLKQDLDILKGRDRCWPGYLCQLAQIYSDDDKRKLWQHVQHGHCFPLPALSAVAGFANSA